MKLVLHEVKMEDLEPGKDYLLYHSLPSRWTGTEWIFAVWKTDGSGWSATGASDEFPDWPTQIFETPDVSRLVDV